MYWGDKIASEILDSGRYLPYHVDDMFTPSGFAHIGSLRGPLLHGVLHRILVEKKNASYTFVFNDFDPLDGLPADLEKDFSKYLGYPLKKVPSPEKGFTSFADYFAQDFKNVLEEFGIKAEYFSSFEMYREGKFNTVIREALDNAEIIQEIYRSVSGSRKKETGWLPLQVICPNCSKLGTTKVTGWDGQKVSFRCEEDLVSWARGCGRLGEISPFDGNGKLPWKVDWPAHWRVMGVTIEGSGKDHGTAGGSRDIARELCKKVFKIQEPYNLVYEFFLLGGKKMSSSGGLGVKARDLIKILPPEVARFLFTRTDYRQTIEFDPLGTMVMPDLFDEYDRAWEAYIKGSDEDLARTFVLSQTKKIPERREIFVPRFIDVVNYVQMPDVDLPSKFEEVKGKRLTSEELKILKDRKKYARVWIKTYAPEQYRLQMLESPPPSVSNLTKEQMLFLSEVADVVVKESDPDKLQLKLYEISKNIGIPSKDAFASIYLAFIGKAHGPKAAWFLLQYPKEKVVERLKEAANVD